MPPQGQEITVGTPDGGVARFPVGTSEADIEKAMRAQFPPSQPANRGVPGIKGFGLGLLKGVGSGLVVPAAELTPGLDPAVRASVLGMVSPHGTAEGAGVGTADVATLIGSLILAPGATLGGLAGGATGAYLGKRLGGSPRSELIGSMLGSAAGAMAGGLKVDPMLHEAAMEDPDIAALKALNVSPGSKAAQSTLRSINLSRPYLKGVQTQADLQARLPQMKFSVWSPYREAVERAGPEAQALESQRLELSALNRRLRTGDPQALQLAKQMNRTPAQLLAEEDKVKARLDPMLRRAGVDPQAVRERFGALAQVGGRVAGRLGGMSKSPMGLGKFVRGVRVGGGVGESGELHGSGMWITAPLRAIGGGIRDISAGRGWWSGSPADIGVREGFRVGGPEPNLRVPITPEVLGPPPAALPPVTGPSVIPSSGRVIDLGPGGVRIAGALPTPSPRLPLGRALPGIGQSSYSSRLSPFVATPMGEGKISSVRGYPAMGDVDVAGALPHHYISMPKKIVGQTPQGVILERPGESTIPEVAIPKQRGKLLSSVRKRKK